MADENKILFDVRFNDAVSYDPKTKTVISVRDGVQEYRGHEVGLYPPNKIFTFYRSPETIKAIADSMDGLPMTRNHVSIDVPVLDSDKIGKVIDGELLDFEDKETNSTVKVKNKVELFSDNQNDDLSLAYHATVIDCDMYDFEQINMVPHHLAEVENGRCGKTCKFIDKEIESMKLNVAFLDADGAVNMQQVLQLVTELPEAIKTMPIKDLAKMVPVLQKAVSFASEAVAEEVAENAEDGMTDEEKEVKRLADEEAAKKASADAANNNGVQDADDEDAAAAKKKEDDDKKFSDSVDAKVAEQNKIYANVVAKAKDFLPDTYNFADKSAGDIMRDCLATQSKDSFADSELPVAFKVMKKSATYAKFADSEKKGDTLDEMKDKEL